MEGQEEKVPVRLGAGGLEYAREEQGRSWGLGECCPRSRSRQIGLRDACCEAASRVFRAEC